MDLLRGLVFAAVPLAPLDLAQAGGPRATNWNPTAAARSHACGSRADVLRAGAKDARLTNWPALRSLRCAAFSSRQPNRHPRPRHARCRAAECNELRSIRLDRHASRSPGVRLVSCRPRSRRISEPARSSSLQPLRQASWHIGRDAASPEHGAARAPVVPPRSPQLRPRQRVRGTCGGIFKAVGRETGSLLRLLRTPPIPNPFP